jgi:amidophosphoribosyltransferase
LRIVLVGISRSSNCHASPLTLEALVAYGRTERQIADYLGADEVVFLDVDGPNGLKQACIEAAQTEDTPIKDLEVGVFTGCYVTGLPDGYLDALSDLRSGRKKQKVEAGIESIKAGEDKSGGAAVHIVPDQREDIRYVVSIESAGAERGLANF